MFLPKTQLSSGKTSVPLLVQGLRKETEAQRGWETLPVHTAQAEAEVVDKRRVLPGRHGFTLWVGILVLSPGCCLTLGKQPSLSELHFFILSGDNSKTYLPALVWSLNGRGEKTLAPNLIFVFPFSKLGGNFDLSVEGISISAGLSLGYDPVLGHSTVTCPRCSSHINTVRIRISGSSMGYDLLGLWMGGGMNVYAHSITQSCPTLCDPMDCSPPGSSVHGILQARILDWVAISSKGSSRLRDWTHISCIVGGFFTTEPPGKSWEGGTGLS